MKRRFLMTLVGLLALLPMQAQNYQRSRYYNPGSGRLDYRGGRATGNWRRGYDYTYYGFRVGPSFSTVSSDDKYLDGSSVKTGLNVGMATGFNMATARPCSSRLASTTLRKAARERQTADASPTT